MMKVIDLLGYDIQLSYRYQVNIDYNNRALLDDVRTWAEQQGIRCSILPGRAFFHSKSDITLFLLRWV